MLSDDSVKARCRLGHAEREKVGPYRERKVLLENVSGVYTPRPLSITLDADGLDCVRIDHVLRQATEIQGDRLSAVACDNYTSFFSLHAGAPNMGGYILDMGVDKFRLRALGIICKA